MLYDAYNLAWLGIAIASVALAGVIYILFKRR